MRAARSGAVESRKAELRRCAIANGAARGAHWKALVALALALALAVLFSQVARIAAGPRKEALAWLEG